MTVRLVDTHCHLDARQFQGETTEALLARAAAAGVERVVTIGTNLETSRAAVALAGRHPTVCAAVGVDPNEAAGFDDQTERALAELCSAPGVVAVGEIGLDYYWDAVPRPDQRKVLEAQLDLARDVGLPVVIHSRDAAEDTAALLEAWAAAHPWRGARPLGVMHCFSGDLDHAMRMIVAGFLVSIAGNVTYGKNTPLQAVAAGVPANALVLETDAPYLAPVPYRGGRSEPAHVAATAAFVADLRGEPLARLAAATTANAERLFALEAVPA